MTKPTQPTLEQLYASASAEQATAAPPNISAAILQAAHTQAAAMAAVEVAAANTTHLAIASSANTALPTAKPRQHMLHTLRALKLRLHAAFAMPSVRYGLPAMMVAMVGIKVAITDMAKVYEAPAQVMSEEVRDQVSAQVSAQTNQAPSPPARPQAMPQASTATATVAAKAPSPAPASNNPPVTTETPIALASKSAPTAFPNVGAPQKQATAQRNDARPQASQDALGTYCHVLPQTASNVPSNVLPTAPSTTVQSTDALATPPKPLAPAPVDTSPKAATHPNNSSSTQERAATPVKPSSAPAVAANRPVFAAAPAPAPVAMPAPSLGMPNSAALSKRSTLPATADAPQSHTTHNASHPTEQLRLSIATTTINNGALIISCQTNPPQKAQVQALLAAGANPHQAWAGNSAASAVRLAQHCGFAEAAAMMLAFGKP